MKSFISNNLLSVILGISMIFTCFLISYFFQKHLFSKYRNKLKGTAEDDDNQS
jgi:hypothetical protein